jgi:hypothetical protein
LESAAYSAIGEHLQKPHNAGSRREARFFNSLLKTGMTSDGAKPLPGVRMQENQRQKGELCRGWRLTNPAKLKAVQDGFKEARAKEGK